MRRIVIAALVSCLVSFAGFADDAPADRFAPLRPLAGTWQGTSEGFGQVAAVTHEWESVLDGKFFRLRTRSVSKDEDGKEEVREDVGYVSFDRDDGVLRFRHFLSEGFLNTFVVEPVSDGLDFEPESTEGYPDMAARLELRFDGDGGYGMVLELGSPGEPLAPCQTITMKKVD